MNKITSLQPNLSLMSQQKAHSPSETGKAFSNMLGAALNQVNDSQIQSNQAVQGLMNGDTTNLHNVMISAQKAEITLTAAVEIRNKVIDAYQSIMRMQI